MREAYLQKVVPALMKEFGYKNIMQVPKLERIVLNVGMGEAIQNVKLLESAAGRVGRNYRPKASDYKGEEGDCLIQIAARDADRHEGDVAEPQDVGVL